MATDDGWLVERDGAVLPQLDFPKRWALRVGGAREIATQTLGLLAIPNGLMIGLTFYRGSTAAQGVFGSAAAFVAAYVGLGLVTMTVYYVAVYRAFQTFVRHQGEQEDVSPLMREVQRVHDRLDDLEDQR